MRNTSTHHGRHYVRMSLMLQAVVMLIAVGLAVGMLTGASVPVELTHARTASSCSSDGSLSPIRTSSSVHMMTVASDASPTPEHACAGGFGWPVGEPQVVRKFEAPKTAWSSGHRGVDLAANPGIELLAPASGTISFAGQVAGKSVVSIRHAAYISSFEPAQTDLPVGTALNKGDVFAHVHGGSDHCLDTCVHWGVRSGEDAYVDPEALVALSRIVLKPT